MSDVIIPVNNATQSNYIISAEETVQTEVVTQKKLTNQEALKLIADFFDKSTAYLKEQRLKVQQ
jgi:hypothetical protein